MKLPELLDTGAIAIPWPTLVNKVSVSGSALEVSETCVRRCGATPQCVDRNAPGENQCPHGMTYFCLNVASESVVVYGLRGPGNTTQLNKYTRDGLKGRAATFDQISAWGRRVDALLAAIDQEFQSRQSELLDPLHDPMRLAKQVNTIANRLVQVNSWGASLDEQIDNASIELKTLVKASELLTDSFDLLAIYFNPAAASFGRRSAISLHGLITKLIAILRVDDGGVTRTSTRIYLGGTCYRNVFVYASFKLVPLALLSNAVKYAMQGNVDVVVEDCRTHVELSVSSVGPLIEQSEFGLIFTKRGRGRWARQFVDGRGVGLYLADLIARAHGASIEVSSVSMGNIQNGIPMARNTFTVRVPISA